jgi:uncharacterized protein (DUF934 family)
MEVIIKDGAIVADAWAHVADDQPLPEGPSTVSLPRWQDGQEVLIEHGAPLGLRLGAADAVDSLADQLGAFELIVLDMAAFTDGRVFSQARLLRERFGYRGELRARGDFIRDQMFFLSRVGVNAFEFPEGTDINDKLKAFGEFSVTYQAAHDDPRPLYRRRG